jgi:hypothetical protein
MMFGGFGPAPDVLKVPARELRDADRQVAEQLKAIHVLLENWRHRPKNWDLVDALLDERLMLRPADVMASKPPMPGSLR